MVREGWSDVVNPGTNPRMEQSLQNENIYHMENRRTVFEIQRMSDTLELQQRMSLTLNDSIE